MKEILHLQQYYELIKKGLQEENILIIDNSKLKSKLDIETKKSTIFNEIQML